MKHIIAVASVAVALVLMAAPAQAQFCNPDFGADNVLTPNEKNRHATSPSAANRPKVTRACADSDDGQMRAIWLNEGNTAAVQKSANNVSPKYSGLLYLDDVTGDHRHRFRCDSDGTYDIWRADPKTDANTISIVCGDFTNRPPGGKITGMPPEVHTDSIYTLTANVTDPDGDVLSFGWNGPGTFSSKTTKTTDWTAAGPFGGQDTVIGVSVRVDDGYPQHRRVIVVKTTVVAGAGTAAAAPGRVLGVGVAPDNAQLVVTWTAVANATGYKVQWKSGSEGYNTGDRQATVTSGSTTRHTIPGLANGTAYTVRVSATRTGADDGLPSAEMTGTPTVSPPPPPPLEQVMGVGVAPDNAQLVVTWTAVANATGYKVQWKSDSEDYNTGDRQATVTSGSTTRYTIPSLTNGTEYTVRVSATRTGRHQRPALGGGDGDAESAAAAATSTAAAGDGP